MKDGVVVLIWHVRQWIVVAVCTSSPTSTCFCHYKILHQPLQHHCYNPSTNSIVTLFCKLHWCDVVLVGDGNSCGCEHSKEVYYDETCLHLLPEVVGGVCRLVYTIQGWWHKLPSTQGDVFQLLANILVFLQNLQNLQISCQWTPHMTLEIPNFAPFWVYPNIFGSVFLQWTKNNPKMQEYQTFSHQWTPHMTLECRNIKLQLFSGYIPMSLHSRIEPPQQNYRLQFI